MRGNVTNDTEQKYSELQFPEIELLLPEIVPRLTELKTLFSEKVIEFKGHTLSFADATRKDFKLRLSEKKLDLEKHNRSHADLLNFAAILILEEETNDLEIQAKDCHIEGQKLLIESLHLIVEHQRRIIETVKELDKLAGHYSNAAEEEEAACGKYQRKQKATKAADVLHDRPGGNREKQKNIREIWASGKYTSRDICVEQECAALGMSFSTARKALRNAPKPT